MLNKLKTFRHSFFLTGSEELFFYIALFGICATFVLGFHSIENKIEESKSNISESEQISVISYGKDCVIEIMDNEVQKVSLTDMEGIQTSEYYFHETALASTSKK
jgi:hypothetical protein